MSKPTCLFIVFCLIAATASAQETPTTRQFTFAWPFIVDSEMQPRGGVTQGPQVTLDKSPSQAWLSLRESGISAQERDRRAILAMAGGYRTSFDFLETIGFTNDFVADQPYQSWATEYVYVVEDRPDFVSLQHIIVMFFSLPDGEVAGPVVIKHWRQDWQYEDTDLHLFSGHNRWQRKRFDPDAVRGSWSQSVYQVDDSPRYQAIGRWQHQGNFSSWISDQTWRPLPRREFSVRNDYHVLTGTNRHTITPTGWVHEEDNLKLVLDEQGNPRALDPYLAREAGLNRYERIVDHDFSAGHEYWSKTREFWADVRQAWRELFEARDRVGLQSSVDGQQLFEVMFGYAGRLEQGQDYDREDGRRFIAETLSRFTR